MNEFSEPLDFFHTLRLSPQQAFHHACAFADDASSHDAVQTVLLLDYAIRNKLAHTSRMKDVLLQGCAHGDVLDVAVALEHISPNVRNDDGQTPLHLASGFDAITLMLIDAGADINACNFQGKTALDEATTKGQVKTALALLACGAKL